MSTTIIDICPNQFFMSVHYHACQSRGYLFTAHEALCQQWRERFFHYDPQRIASILKLSYDSEYLYLSYFQSPYRLRLADGALEKQQKSGLSSGSSAADFLGCRGGFARAGSGSF